MQRVCLLSVLSLEFQCIIVLYDRCLPFSIVATRLAELRVLYADSCKDLDTIGGDECIPGVTPRV